MANLCLVVCVLECIFAREATKIYPRSPEADATAMLGLGQAHCKAVFAELSLHLAQRALLLSHWICCCIGVLRGETLRTAVAAECGMACIPVACLTKVVCMAVCHRRGICWSSQQRRIRSRRQSTRCVQSLVPSCARAPDSDLDTLVSPVDPRKGPFRKSGGERQASEIAESSRSALSTLSDVLQSCPDVMYYPSARTLFDGYRGRPLHHDAICAIARSQMCFVHRVSVAACFACIHVQLQKCFQGMIDSFPSVRRARAKLHPSPSNVV